MPSTHDLAVAFALTSVSGLSTTIGAAFVFLARFYNPVCLPRPQKIETMKERKKERKKERRKRRKDYDNTDE